MKKLVVLTLLLAAGMLWAQAAAPAAPWSDPHKMDMGITFDYMWIQDFGNGKEFSDRPIMEMKFNWAVDDFTAVYLEYDEGPMNSGGDTTGITAGQGGYGRSGKWNVNADRGYNVFLGANGDLNGLDKFYLTTNLQTALKLPMPVSVMYGYQEWNNKDGIKVTKSEFEDFLGEADMRSWGGQIEVTPVPVMTLRANWIWNAGATDWGTPPADLIAPTSWYTAGDDNYVAKDYPLYLVGAYGTSGPLTYEATYFSNNNAAGKGWIEGGVKFVQDVTPAMNVAACVSFEYDLQEDPYPAYGWGGFAYTAQETYGTAGPSAAPNSKYMLQAGVQATYMKMAALGLSYRGAEDMLAGAFQVQLWAMPISGQPLEFLAQIGLGLDTDVFADTFDSLEVALRYATGKVLWYLGYFMNSEYGRAIAKEWVDFDVAGVYPGGTTSAATDLLRNECGGIFMRARISI